MSTSTDHPRRHFDDLVPFYVSGQISETDRAWVERYLAENPEAAAVLDWHRDLMDEVVSQARARAMQVPENVGWSRVASALREARPATPVSLPQRLQNWLGTLVPQRLAPVAAVLLLVQGVTIGALLMREPVDESQLVRSASQVAPREVLQVRFKPTVTEPDLRALLYGAGARIVDGPDQLGDYVIEPRRGPLAELQAELQRSPLVQSITLLKAWKPEPREDG